MSSDATGGVAIGQNAVVEQGASNAVALGTDSVADEANTVSVGTSTSQRRITHVADGVNDSDAVNLGQVNTVQNQVSGNAAAIATNSSAITAIEAQSAVLSSSESDSASSSGSNSLAIGSGASAHDDDTAIGANATVTADSSTAVGSNTLIESENAVAVGADATVSSDAIGGVAIGQNAVVEQGASNAVALGTDSVADEEDTVSVGSDGNERRITNVADGVNDSDAVNLGQVTSLISAEDVLWIDSAATSAASATGSNATAIGSGSTATADGSVALGQGSIADEANTVSVGTSTSQRRITNGSDCLIVTGGEQWLNSTETGRQRCR